MSNNVSYQPVQKISVRAEQDLPAFRFISHLGTICGDGLKSLGTTDRDWLDGTNASVVTLGTVAVETSTTVHIGDDITSDLIGKAKPAGTTDKVNGRALEDCLGSGYVKILLVP